MSQDTRIVEIDDADLDEACALLGGATSWRTHRAEALGVPVIKMSDGPNGVRGEQFGLESTPGVVIPVGFALGSTWDPGLLERLGSLLAVECRRRGAHVLLAPTVNIVRLPIGGRAFECYSEDPELTARLAVGFVRGVQSGGVAATVKHFVGNDTEIERMTVDARIDPAVRREVYLRPFEAVVREAGVWAVMSAYNRVDGEYCAHNRWLLTDLLRDEWGFDGVVISDWGGAHDTVGSATGGLTIAMPGPRTPFGAPLAAAVRAGAVPRETVGERVAEVARLARRTGAGASDPDRLQESVDDPAERALCREAAVSAMVLARNTGALPLGDGARIAVIGANASDTRIMGGGSSSLKPLPAPSILDSLRDRFGDSIVGHAVGATIDKLVPPLSAAQLRTPDGQPGLRVELRNGTVSDVDSDVEIVSSAVAESTALLLSGDGAPSALDANFTVTLVGEIIPPADGLYELGAAIAGGGRAVVGDTVLIDDPDRRLPRSDLWFGFGSHEFRTEIEATAGVAIPVRMVTTGRRGTAAMRLGMRPIATGSLIDSAVALAAEADVAVVVVGTNDEWESEGVDRVTLELPGEQDELVRRVAASAARTVVVLNSGAPVAMPWIDEVDAVVIAGFAGIETGPAVAAVLSGDVDPGGRLPVTYPVRLEDCPAWPHYVPVDGAQTYGEGRNIGYRGHLASGVAPLLPFGHGLSYGSSTWSDIAVIRDAAGAGVIVSVTVANTGDRAVTDVVQVYVTHPHGDMAPMTLAGFAKTTLAVGDTARLEIRLDDVAIRRWDESVGDWVIDDGEREIIVARSVSDVVARLTHPRTSSSQE